VLDGPEILMATTVMLRNPRRCPILGFTMLVTRSVPPQRHLLHVWPGVDRILWRRGQGCVYYFLPSSAYLAVRETPSRWEPRAQAISFIFAIAQFFGGVVARAVRRAVRRR
jgi:hypothetical protein